MQPNEMVDESQQHADDIDSAGSACGDNPKSSKPMMEKRRRARINNSLNELKTILLDALKKDTTRHSKLEKADILEMTVKYLRRLERQRVTAIKMNPAVVNKYKAGFNECRNEVMKFLSTHEGVAVGVRTQLLGHLENCQQSLQDQDQDFSCDEFADPPMDWKTSAMQIDSQTSPRTKSPSTSSYPTLQNEDQNQTDAMKELGAQDYPTVSTGLVEGQLQILSSATPSPPSSVEISSPNRAPFKDVAFVVPRVGPESGFVANIPNSSSSYGHPVVFQTLPANTVPHETVAYRNPEKVSYRSIEAVDITQPVFTTTGHSPFVPVTTPSGNMGFTVGYLIPFTGNGDTNTHEIQAPSLTQEGHGSLVCHTREDLCIGSYNSSPGHYQREHMVMNSGQAQYSQQLDRRDSNASNPWRPWSHDKS